MVRNSLSYVGWNQREEVAMDLKLVYTVATGAKAELHLTAFEVKRDEVYPPIAQSWRKNWARSIPFFNYSPEIRKVMHITNAIETVNMSLRKATKSRGLLPNDEPLRDWNPALNRFSIQFEERMPQQ